MANKAFWDAVFVLAVFLFVCWLIVWGMTGG